MPRTLSRLPRPTPRTLPHTEKATMCTEPRVLRSRGTSSSTQSTATANDDSLNTLFSCVCCCVENVHSHASWDIVYILWHMYGFIDWLHKAFPTCPLVSLSHRVTYRIQLTQSQCNNIGLKACTVSFPHKQSLGIIHRTHCGERK